MLRSVLGDGRGVRAVWGRGSLKMRRRMCEAHRGQGNSVKASKRCEDSSGP